MPLSLSLTDKFIMHLGEDDDEGGDGDRGWTRLVNLAKVCFFRKWLTSLTGMNKEMTKLVRKAGLL